MKNKISKIDRIIIGLFYTPVFIITLIVLYHNLKALFI